jgi:phosphoribosylformylglycinamidine synthase II
MPNEHPMSSVSPTSANQTPTPCVITPALLKQHSITADEYRNIEQKLGRVPSLTELGIFSVMWSEHCSYKSSRVHLKRLPTTGERTSGPGAVVQGPGENAGIIDVGDGWACAFKIESHNHPSYIEPYQGAATGVGGILRDIFTMGARPLAVMDSLRFGPLDAVGEPDDALRTKNHQIATGVVHGVAGYGNCFGVPNLGGETRFEPCYSGNPLLNAFALGLVRTDEIFYAKATGVGNPVIYVGAKTGRDGIHGATMASEEFTEGSEQKRPNVQMGDPFLEKLLLEACLEAMQTGAVVGIQDMGAAGLTCSTCEMGARGELGVSIELDLVPQRETGMTSYEIMLSESQERMLLVADKGREQEVLDVFAKWGLDASIVGIVTADDVMRVRHHGELIAEIPNKALTEEAPVYHRPVGEWKAPVPADPPQWVLDELGKPRDYTADLKKLLAAANICDKRWVYEQYDSMVQTNTVQGPGCEAGVMRIKGTGGAASHNGRRSDEADAASSTSVAQGVLGAIAEFVAESTPKGSATLATGNEDAANPVVELKDGHAAAPAGDATTISKRTHETPSSHATHSLTPADPSNEAADSSAQHGLLEKIAGFIASSTPRGEATLATGNEDAANPVVAPEHGRAAASAGTGDAFRGVAKPGNTVEEPRSGKSSKGERGIAMALAGNGRWCYLDPKIGAMHAVAEAARKVACTGATPVAATNCLNFGNPEKPEIMAQLSAAIDGIAETCNALGTPITGGNVSLYNETKGEGIYPTPVIGIVGILDDVTKAVPSGFARDGEQVLLLTSVVDPLYEIGDREFGSSEFAKTVLGALWGTPPAFEQYDHMALQKMLVAAADARLLTSASDLSDGGVAVALARACLQQGIGADIDLPFSTTYIAEHLFRETGATALVTCSSANLEVVRAMAQQFAIEVYPIGVTGGAELKVQLYGVQQIAAPLTALRDAYTKTLPEQLAAEVVTA